MDGPVLLFHNPQSEYFADLILQDLIDMKVQVRKQPIERREFPNGERYYRLLVDNSLSLLGKIGVYVASITSDEEILDLCRVGGALAQAGLRRRVFVLPFLAYSSMDRAELPGEVVTAKSNTQMIALLCAEEGTVFLFVDLHYPCLLHYFEGPCVRIELSCQSALIQEIEARRYDRGSLVVGSTNLRRANWVNRYATELKVPLAFMREKERETKQGGDIAFRSVSGGVVGDVRGKHVLIYDDIIRSGKTIISAANCYIDAGATGVDVCTSHLACFSDEHIRAIIESRIGIVIATNSHPTTCNSLVLGSPKFRIVNIADLFNQCLYELLPSADRLRGVSF